MASFARVVHAEADPAQADEGIARINEMVPQARKLPGFQHGTWLVDRATGKSMSVVVYDSEEHLRQADEAAAQLRQDVGSPLGVKFTAVEVYEVAAEV
jgi:heme-degrading monooxygenase HmoA